MINASLRQRFLELMRRHIEDADTLKTDDEFVRAVVNRYLKARGSR